MHTAEHVLNQTMVQMFGCDRSFSNHLEKKKSKCDYRFTRALTADEELKIESQVNEVLVAGVDVREEIVTREKASELFNLERLPDATGEVIRIVRVGEYDACPCIGDHVKNTSEVGQFVFGSSSFEDGILRIRFKLKRAQ
ncbi:MAG: hypothetical protein JEZ14_08410 [Marinilabiliaceae bacterium]|nr:hypothetical protein [Marinilabiliaceae bacterium]